MLALLLSFALHLSGAGGWCGQECPGRQLVLLAWQRRTGGALKRRPPLGLLQDERGVPAKKAAPDYFL